MRLNAIQKAEILAKLNRGVNGNHLAKEYGVAKSTISLLRKRKYDEILQSGSGTINRASSENGSIQSGETIVSHEGEAANGSNGEERVEKKSRIFPTFRRFKLYKQSHGVDENQHSDNDTASEYDDDNDYEEEEEEEEYESESEENEENFNEICRKLQRVCDNLNVPTQSLREMEKLITKLWSCNYIE